MGWLLLLFRILCFHLMLFHFPSFSSSFAPSCHPHQSSALLQFKSSFTIDTANIYYSHCVQLFPKTTSWENGTDCCSWLGVTCDTMSGHVIGLDLSCSGLQGKIHLNSSLFRLTHLHRLNLAFNDFFESQLSSRFGGFVSLTHLNLSHSDFEGEIPSEISHLSKLVSLDLSWNSLKLKETTWKRLVQNATVLRELLLEGTNMSLIRPSSLSLLLNFSSSLVTLRLEDAGLRGNFPKNILCFPNLQELYLSDNDFQGLLPSLNCSTSLSILDLSECQFQGPIPSSFSNLTHLTSLILSANNLNGSIPSSLSALPHLTFLDLSSNELSGSIPSSLSNLQHLIHLDLSSNELSGSIPSSLSSLQHLIHLDLSSNKFSGEIPDVFGGLTKLETLYLRENNLRGQLPSSLFDLTRLSYLGCSSNKLEGPLPNKITGFSNLSYLLLDDNLLNGTIPSWCLSLPSLTCLYLSNNHFTGHIGAISSYSLEYLSLCNNKIQGNIPESIFHLVNLTALCLSSNNLSGPVNFQLLSKLQNLERLLLSQNSQLSLNFEANVNYSFSHLYMLELSSYNLTEFHILFGKFPNLTYLDLSNNKLHGNVPKWLYEMDSLYFLNLSQNLLTSMDQFSRNCRLGYLDLSFNLLAGDVTSSICNASSLEMLNLSRNKLTGIIPQCLANLSSLRVLDLQMNKLYGTLPSTFPKNNILVALNLNDNQLEGPLPKSLSNCTQLVVLNIGNNQIEDTFPHWLQTLPYLSVLVLRGNKFHGPISNLKTNHSFHSLTIFDVSYNNFRGPLPSAYINNFKAMMMKAEEAESSLEYYLEFWIYSSPFSSKYDDSLVVSMKGINIMLNKIPKAFVNIDFSKNRFEGEIPNVIGKLHALKGLNLSYNRLIGHIPRSVGSLTNLESLDLSSNMLTGGIPSELTNLNYLEVLNLSQNHLVGEIPQGKQFNTFSNDSYEGNWGLCGLPLLIKCNKDPEQYSPSSPSSQHEQKFGFGWKPVALGYGCGVVFGVGLGCCVLFIGKPQWLVRMVGGEPNKRVKRRARMRRTRGNRGRMNELVPMA